MCLSIKEDSVAIVAEEDITVYKYLHQRIKKDKTLGARYTPYRGKIILIGKTYKSELFKNEDSITKGLHSFAELSSCEDDANSWMLSEYKAVLVKCIIPKGSSYYVGEFGGDKSYASDTLKYVEVIN